MSPDLAAPNDTPAAPVLELQPEGMSLYVAPTAVPHPTQHATFELETVRVAPEADPRRAPTIVRPRRQPAVLDEPPAVAAAVSSPRPATGGSAAVSLWLVAALAGLALVAGSAAARMILVYAASSRVSVAVPAPAAPLVADPVPGTETAALLERPRSTPPEGSRRAAPPPSAVVPAAAALPTAPPRAAPRSTSAPGSTAPPRSTRRIF
ncbi:MAG TPA: hypothetical protein PLU22_20435 [Polyangiaceae bacterium]|nr:hypothetical protein [Polyangiaceae bacterium]